MAVRLKLKVMVKGKGVEKVAPCHCSGDLARKMFKEAFQENYIEVGVGADP